MAAEAEAARSGARKLTKAIIGLILFGAVAYGGFEYWRKTTRPIQSEAEKTATADLRPPAQTPDTVRATAPAERPESAPSSEMLVRRGLKSVNVRAGASLQHPVIAKLSGGDRIEAVSEEADWVQVRIMVDGMAKSGWLSRSLLER